MFTLGVDALSAIRGDSRYIRPPDARGALSFSEAAHQPMLSQHYYLADANVAPCLDGALLEQEKLIGVLSLEYAESTLISDDTRNWCVIAPACSATGSRTPWRPTPRTSRPTRACQPDRQRLLPRPAALGHGPERCPQGLDRRVSASRSGSLAHSPLRGGGDAFAVVKPMPMDIGPGREIFQHGQSLYVEDLALRYPQSSLLLALDAKAYVGIPFPGPNGLPWGSSPCCSPPLADPAPLLDVLYEQREGLPASCSAWPMTMPCAWPKWPSTPTTACW